MPRTQRRLAIAHGEPPPAQRSPAAVDLSSHAEVTVVVRPRGSEEEWRKLVARLTSGLPGDRRYLTHAELARNWAASPADLEAVQSFATAHRLKVVSADTFRRCVVLSGPLSQHARAFGVELHAVDHPDGTFLSHSGAPTVPEAVHPLIECILGLDTRPISKPHAAPAPQGHGMDRQALLDAYAIPPRRQGKGQCVAIVELGGGFYKSDLVDYFRQFRLAPPPVKIRGIGGVKNSPAPKAVLREVLGSFFGAASPPATVDRQAEVAAAWTLETTTDIAMAGTIAPKASILLVQTSGNAQGQYHAISSVVADRINKPSVLSISWGGMEPHQVPAAMRAMDRWFQTAAVLGMTVCCSSGDSGDGTMVPNTPPNQLTVQFPATSPHVLACGGTTLHPKAGTEVAWKQKSGKRPMASGGGFSEFFVPMPEWQRAAGIDPQAWIPKGNQSGTGRAIPDVAAKANIDEDYCVIVGGMQMPACGTSAAAPLWGGLVAILNEALGTRVGSLNELLYDGTLTPALRDIVAGNTGLFRARKGWDACTGWGSPNGEALLRVLRGRVAR